MYRITRELIRVASKHKQLSALASPSLKPKLKRKLELTFNLSSSPLSSLPYTSSRYPCTINLSTSLLLTKNLCPFWKSIAPLSV